MHQIILVLIKDFIALSYCLRDSNPIYVSAGDITSPKSPKQI